MRRLLSLTFTIAFFALVSSPASAAFQINQPGGGGIQVAGQDSDSLLSTVINNLIKITFTVSGVTVVAMVLWGAFQWISSGGDKEKLAGAQKRIVQALVGMVFLALAFLLIAVVGNITGFNPLEGMNLPSLGTSTNLSVEQRKKSCEGRQGDWYWDAVAQKCKK